LLRQIGELMHARGGFDPGAHARAGAAILASGDRRAALAGLHIPTLVLYGQADQLMRPEGMRHRRRHTDATLILLPDMGNRA
jgi:pimeloyl-ACP methyl ester carboxylesterase